MEGSRLRDATCGVSDGCGAGSGGDHGSGSARALRGPRKTTRRQFYGRACARSDGRWLLVIARGGWRTTISAAGDVLERKADPLARFMPNIGDRLLLVAPDASDSIACVFVVSVTQDGRPVVRVAYGELPRTTFAILPAGRGPA